MAINSSWPTSDGKRGEEVCFVDCALFGVRAQVVRKYFGKGSNILIEGRLRHEVWDTEDEHGKKVTRSKHSIVVDDFFFVDPRSKPLHRDPAEAASAQPDHGPVAPAPGADAPAIPAADLTRLESNLGLDGSTFDTAQRELGSVAERVQKQQQAKQL